MDGNFVKAKSIQLSQIPNLKKYKINFEAHLMVKNPKPLIIKLKQKGFQKIIFHYSALKDTQKINYLIKFIKDQKMQSWIAINPEVKVESILPFFFEVHGVLFMGVHPGEEHQKFIGDVYRKIKLLKKINTSIIIQVDGGVNDKTTKKLAKLGVNYINSGSYISNSENPKKVYIKLNNIYAKYVK